MKNQSSKEGGWQRGEKKVQDGRTQVLANEEPSNGGGWMVRGWKRYKIEGPKSWQMKNPPMGGGWMVRGWKRYKIEGPKSWQMRNPPKRVDRQGNRNKSSTQTCLPPFRGEKHIR